MVQFYFFRPWEVEQYTPMKVIMFSQIFVQAASGESECSGQPDSCTSCAQAPVSEAELACLNGTCMDKAEII